MPTPERYRRKLPHIQNRNAVLFITFRLKGTLPKHLMQELSGKLKQSILNNAGDKLKIQQSEEEYYESIESVLDESAFGSDYLKEPELTQIVIDSFHYLDGKDFKLICFCIMSNHIHFIAYNFQKPVYRIMDSLKRHTSRQINLKLGKTGPFWQREYFDRVVRDRNDLQKKINYVLNNPVKIKLEKNWKDWPFIWCHKGF
jgi:REP element-mobilizing transposase RayT